EVVDRREVRARPALEPRVADRTALVDRLPQVIRGLRELAGPIRQDVAEVDVRVGRRLLRAQRAAALERSAALLLRARELAELRPAPRDGRAFERQVARVAGALEAVDGGEQVP